MPLIDKAHQQRYVFNPTSAAALLVFERLGRDGGVQEILTVFDRTRAGLRSGVATLDQVRRALAQSRRGFAVNADHLNRLVTSSPLEELGRHLVPVGMTVELYANGIKYRPDNPDESQRVARKMAEDGPQPLRILAHAIAETGGLGCEQETLYDDVLDALSGHLRDIERSSVAENP